MAGTILLTYALISGIFAYLAIQLDQEHAKFKLLNLGISYLTLIYTTLLAIPLIGEEYPDTGVEEAVTTLGTYYQYLLMFIFGYFVFYVLYKILKDTVEL